MKALIFSPFANIWEHALPEAMVADSLRSQGYEIVVVRCDGLYQDFCVAMSAAGLTADDSDKRKQQVCRACIKRRDFLDRAFDFREVLVERFLDENDHLKASQLVASTTEASWKKQTLNGIPIGRYAAYEFVLRNKIDGDDIPPDRFGLYLDQLRASVSTLLAAEKILDQEKPDVVVTSNRLYSAHHSFVAVADRRGIPNYSIQGGDHIVHRGESITLYKNGTTLFELLDSGVWEARADRPLSAASVHKVASHLRGLLDGSSAFAYSSQFEATLPSEIRDRLGIPAAARVLLAPLSSEDEHNAALLADLFPDVSGRSSLFEDQFAWIRAVIDIARARPEDYFIIRLHPRMFPNKREQVMAPIVRKVQEMLVDIPSNVVVNTPDDNLSIYDLLQVTDVMLNFGSTVGLEFATYGIPVVTPSNRYFYTYPHNIHRVRSTLAEFTTAIDEALAEGWSFEIARTAFRWYAFLFDRVALDFSEQITSRPSTMRPKKPGLKLWLWKKLVFLVIQFGPLVRERLSLRRGTLSSEKQKIISDVIHNQRNNFSESIHLAGSESDEDIETRAITEFFEQMCSVTWAQITEEGSLAERIRRALPLVTKS